MGVKAECDGDDCQEDILEETGIQVDKGETRIDAETVLVGTKESLGVFCSIGCLVNTLGGENL
jgi:hypothetical protein